MDVISPSANPCEGRKILKSSCADPRLYDYIYDVRIIVLLISALIVDEYLLIKFYNYTL